MLARLTKTTMLLIALNFILGAALAVVLFLPEDKEIVLTARATRLP